eukprot:scaffold189417_cov23-Tisochrysis_lutea.AAC.1
MLCPRLSSNCSAKKSRAPLSCLTGAVLLECVCICRALGLPSLLSSSRVLSSCRTWATRPCCMLLCPHPAQTLALQLRWKCD